MLILVDDNDAACDGSVDDGGVLAPSDAPMELADEGNKEVDGDALEELDSPELPEGDLAPKPIVL